jgi:RimJ/RimL family protein N-acetyltransferase
MKSLFEEVFFNLNSLVVINGDNEGRIWVDDIKNANTGLLVDNEWSAYLAGDPSNKEFNRSLGKLLKNEIMPKAEKHSENANPEYNAGEFVIYYNNEDWFIALEQDFGIEDLLPLRRYYYRFNQLKFPNWKDRIPQGFSIQKVDRRFLQQKHLVNFDEVYNWVVNTWRCTEDFFGRGFGFCLVKENEEIVSWGIADWATEDQAEMGIGTSKEYRRQGFATTVTSAAADFCLTNDIRLGWHCSEHNNASWKTAEKVGFIRKRGYTAALRNFDNNANLLENAWYKGLYLKKPEEGLHYIDRLITKISPEARHYFLRAQILLEAERNDEALAALFDTLEVGPQDIERFKTVILERDIFKPIRNLEGFSRLIEKIEIKKQTVEN